MSIDNQINFNDIYSFFLYFIEKKDIIGSLYSYIMIVHYGTIFLINIYFIYIDFFSSINSDLPKEKVQDIVSTFKIMLCVKVALSRNLIIYYDSYNITPPLLLVFGTTPFIINVKIKI